MLTFRPSVGAAAFQADTADTIPMAYPVASQDTRVEQWIALLHESGVVQLTLLIS